MPTHKQIKKKKCAPKIKGINRNVLVFLGCKYDQANENKRIDHKLHCYNHKKDLPCQTLLFLVKPLTFQPHLLLCHPNLFEFFFVCVFFFAVFVFVVVFLSFLEGLYFMFPSLLFYFFIFKK